MIEELARIVGPKNVLTAREDLIAYAFDATAALKQMPASVVFPESTGEVSQILKIARKHKVPVVTRGSGTGLSGGSVPLPGALVICMTRFNRLVEVDARNLTLRSEAGVVTQAICDAADQAGLFFYPPDPGSVRVSTIGGNIAENAGGLRGLKYGVTRDYVMGLEVVLADGTVCSLGNKCVKDVAGYSLKDLFIGSEGTLGIVTSVLLKLLPRPEARKTLLACFPTMEDAAESVASIIAERIIPCTLEFLDNRTVRCVEDYARVGLPVDAGAVLLIECDGHPAAVADDSARILALCEKHGGKVKAAATQEEAAGLAAARRSAFSALARLRPTTILEDATVPRSEIPKMVRFIQEVSLRHGLEIATFGHFGDGNLHPTFLTDERDLLAMRKVEIAMEEIFDFALSLGGTITGEHGVGLAKKKFLKRQLGEGSYLLMREIKKALDPDNLLNPGKIFDL